MVHMNIHQMSRDLVRVARTQHGVVTLSQLVGLGFSRQMVSRRTRNGELIRLSPRVYALASFPSTWQRQYKAAELSLPGSAIASFAAAKVHGFDGFTVAKPEL